MRQRMSMKASKRLFTKTADRVNPRNAPRMLMRGGYRL